MGEWENKLQRMTTKYRMQNIAKLIAANMGSMLHIQRKIKSTAAWVRKYKNIYAMFDKPTSTI